VVHVPDGPAGVMAIDVAWTVPAESRGPLARTHCPVWRMAAEAVSILVTVAVVGTVIVWLPEPVVNTVTVTPTAPSTSPLTNACAG
jgi:hypothetical protein